MPQITAITTQKHDATRCNIDLDGRFFCGMKTVTVMEHRLKVGSVVTAEELARIQLESEKQTALDKALTHITASMKTEKEIGDYLRRKGYLPDVCDFVIEKMRSYGFSDDAEYARAYAENAAKRKGARLIVSELRRKGIAEDIAERAVEGLESGESARAVLEKYLRGKDRSERKVMQGAYRYLLSKGFDYDTARAALEGLGEDE